MNIRGKVFIVTAASEGQGLALALAQALLRLGAKVGLADAYAVKGAHTLRELQNKFGPEHVHFVVCDVTKRADLVTLYDGMESYFGGPVDVFCNLGTMLGCSSWQRYLQTNLVAMIEATEVALERMHMDRGGQGGLIVNTAMHLA